MDHHSLVVVSCILLLFLINGVNKLWFQGEYIWVQPTTNGPFDIPTGGKILTADKKRIRIKDDSGNELYISHQQILKPMHTTSVQGVEDMINLGDLQEYAILRNLQIRYHNKLIYVRFR